MPILVTTCTTLSWTAVGDPEAIQALLAEIPAIGKKRSQGWGHVLSWTIKLRPDLDPFTAGHLSPTGTLNRPVPASCLTDRPDVPTGGLGWAGVRPPTMHHSRQTDLVLPSLPRP